jgi:hypothetical protein
MKNGKDFYISLDSFLDALNTDDEDRNKRKEILEEYHVLAEMQGELYLSVQAYMQIVLPQIDKLSIEAERLKQDDDIAFYGFGAEHFLQEWIVIIDHMSQHLARDHRFSPKDETVELSEEVMEYLQKIFDHLIEANRLLVKFGQINSGISTGNQTEE